MVLFVLFGACPVLAEQLRESGTYVAMDNFFTSPILFLCLLLQGVFAVGTLREIHRGASHAVRYWKATRQTPKKRGDMRCGIPQDAVLPLLFAVVSPHVFRGTNE